MRLIFIIFLYSISTSAKTLSLNDISVLLPLPTVAEIDFMIGAEAVGAQGALLAQNVYARFPQLIPESPNSDTYKNLLKVVAIRLDPCFTEGSFVSACRHQIRMVWQPVKIAANSQTTTRDAAVHTFYEFNDLQWDSLVKSWGSLASGKVTDALQVHPKIKSEGLKGMYWSKMRRLLLKYCGAKNMVRATIMNVQMNEQMWVFMGFDINANGLTRIKIPRINSVQQSIIMSPFDTSEFKGSIRPDAPQNKNLAELIQHSPSVSGVLNEDQIQRTIQQVIKFENPTLNNPGTLDCASCHIAHGVRQWGERNYKTWNWASDFSDITYQSNLNIKNNTAFKTNQFRAFGYFEATPLISQRVTNESAAVLSSF